MISSSSKACPEYREGRFGKAAEWLQKIDISHLTQWHAVQDCMLLAMAQYRLNQNEAGEITLRKGLDLAKANAPKGKARDLGMAWNENMVAQALIREAKTVVQRPGAGQ
jgi:hypothetical protein